MDEHFLHYVWKFQKFDQGNLKLSDSQAIKVFDPGYHNQDSGPDFEEARLKIDHIEWVGQVEVHINSSDWNKHSHSSDRAYNNVILHVVWNHDTDIKIDNQVIPTLELKNFVNPLLVKKYQLHKQSSDEIACGSQLEDSGLAFQSMLDKTLVERLERKANDILNDLRKFNNDWEAITYRKLASNFGFSTNKESFISLIEKLPYDVIKKNTTDPLKIEALVFGQAGFLSLAQDDYSGKLKAEHQYLSSKFRLKHPLERSGWKFGKMRPANFPTIRLAQFASLLHHRPKLFSMLISIEQPKEIISMLSFELTSYWQTHYDFGKQRKRIQKKVGQSTFDNILINTVTPLLTAYSKYTDQQSYLDKALDILEQVRPESNRITKKWFEIGKNAKSAFDSQAMIQLYSEYCSKRKCLQCSVGVKILNR